MNLSNKLSQRIRTHLAEVRKYLGNLPADERKEILQTIESHIYDALENRSDGEPTPALLDAVIAEMDPPESYGELPAITGTAEQASRFKKLKKPISTLLLMMFIGFVVMALLVQWDQDPSGCWKTVDFVPSIEQFDPKTKVWRSDLHLNDLTFFPDGKTDRLFWTWKDGVLHHSGDNTDAKFLIKKISGTEYLFLEWISGDVILKGMPSKYYVLKKSN